MENSIYAKLFNIQQELKAPKNLNNDFGKYKYRNCEGILEAVKPLLNKNRVVLLMNDTVVNVDDRNYIKAEVVLVDIESGEKVSNTGWAREELTKKGVDGSQITGASSSYARKYALNGLFAIDDSKDSDATNTGEFVPCTKAQLDQMSALEVNVKNTCMRMHVARLEDLSQEQAEYVITKKMQALNKENK